MVSADTRPSVTWDFDLRFICAALAVDWGLINRRIIFATGIINFLFSFIICTTFVCICYNNSNTMLFNILSFIVSYVAPLIGIRMDGYKIHYIHTSVIIGIIASMLSVLSGQAFIFTTIKYVMLSTIEILWIKCLKWIGILRRSYCFVDVVREHAVSKHTFLNITVVIETQDPLFALFIPKREYMSQVEAGKIVEDHWPNPGSDFFISWEHLWRLFKKYGYGEEIHEWDTESDEE